jgi:hypothetical protein
LATIAVNRRPTSRYRPPVTARHLPPAAPQGTGLAQFRAPPSLAQFVLLSMLLHALLIALFGAPSGGSREGRAMWGSMQVELRGLVPEATPALPPPTRADRAPEEGAVPMTPPAETQAAAVAPSGPAIVEVPAPFPRLLDRIRSEETRLADPPALVVPPPTEGRDLRPPPRARLDPAPVVDPDPLPLALPAGTERVLAEPPPIAVPLAQPLRAPAAPSQAAPVEVEAPSTRPIATPPIEVRAIPVPVLDGVVPRDEAAAPLDLAPMPQIKAAPPAPAFERAPATTQPPPTVADPAIAPRDAGSAAPRIAPAPEPGRFRRADPSSAYDPTAPAPSIDAEAARRRAGELAREGAGSRAVLPFPMPPVPEKKSKLETAIENARKPDCRTAYQAMGLAAIVPLIANEFGEGKCRW